MFTGQLRNVILVVALVGAAFLLGVFVNAKKAENKITVDPVYAKFEQLSKQGNSSCSASFQTSIDSMSDDERLKGSCCSQMTWHRYSEQVAGLKKYADILEIPPDPYDIEVKLAKMLKSHYDDKLTDEQQKAYDYAMANSDEKGPCCCKCWRWYVYGGLAKILIQKHNFSGEQITEVWNFSDGCGGDSEHHHG